jgi:hypothetical protein
VCHSVCHSVCVCVCGATHTCGHMSQCHTHSCQRFFTVTSIVFPNQNKVLKSRKNIRVVVPSKPTQCKNAIECNAMQPMQANAMQCMPPSSPMCHQQPDASLAPIQLALRWCKRRLQHGARIVARMLPYVRAVQRSTSQSKSSSIAGNCAQYYSTYSMSLGRILNSELCDQQLSQHLG